MIPRRIVFSLGVFLSSLAGQTSGAQLGSETEAICVELERLGGNVEALTQQIADSIHYYGFCEDIGECYGPANKRIEDYSFFIVAPTGVDVGKSLTEKVYSSLVNFNEVTGKTAHLQMPQTLNFLALVFVDEEDATNEQHATIENIIAPENLGFSEIRRKLFSNWLESASLCNEITTEYEDGTIQDAQVWVKLGYSEEDTYSCVEAMTLKTMGLKKVESTNGNDAAFRNSWLDANSLVLAVLYSDLVKPGQSNAQTALKLASDIRTHCQ